MRLTKKKEEVHSICLTKQPLNGLKAQVGLVLDFSGSMDDLYYNGTVQEVIENTLPLAMEFDDNGTMEVWIFENGFTRLPDINLNNCAGYVKREILGKYEMGGTYYAPVIKDVVKEFNETKIIDKGIPDITAKTINFLIEQKKCICGVRIQKTEKSCLQQFICMYI